VKPKTFGVWFRERRREKAISLRALATACKISFSYLSKVETGDMPPPSAETLALLGTQIGVSPSRMYLEAGIVPPQVKEAFKRGVSIKAYEEIIKVLEGDEDGVDYRAWCPDCPRRSERGIKLL
jgi:HTH-type transcriptional regulator, competence development regulator